MPRLWAGQVEIAYTHHAGDAGTAGATPLVLVHGLAASADTWADVLPAARTRGPVLTYDLRGHGASGNGPNQDAVTLADLTADLAALLRGLNIDRAHVLGHSLGGVIALDFALRHPAAVASLILVSTSPEGGTATPHEAARALATRPDLTPHLGSVGAPTLVIAGEFDPPPVQRGAELLHGWIPNSRLVRIAGAGHHPHRDQPEIFASLVLSFIQEVDTPVSSGEAQ